MNTVRITFRDLLDESIVVDGVSLDAKIRVIVRNLGGVYEIDYFDAGDVHINVNGDLFKLDQSQFKAQYKTLYQRFINACELLALKKAKNTPDYKWEKEELGA